ncbi:UNVERIFIED_CONTAM: hypothetical protein Sradi_0890700 [Sesamum radiatum]|uniref:Uncharacterized protein n=1 Tax=Sesamum radiatum TaxID=300843 RepID=A0AAW2V270_SESRA
MANGVLANYCARCIIFRGAGVGVDRWGYGTMVGGIGSRGFSPDDALTILANVLGGLHILMFEYGTSLEMECSQLSPLIN